MKFLSRSSLCALLLLATACGTEATVTDDGEQLDTTDSALVTEKADRSCGVVLRELKRNLATNGTIDHTCSSNGTCWQAWTGYVDVDANLIAAGGKVGAAYSVGASTTVTRVTASLVGDSTEPGFKRFKFRIYKNIWATTLPIDQQSAVTFRVAPYVTLPDNTRKIDRNRVVGLKDSVIVDSSNSWMISDDAAVCHPSSAPRGVVRFNGGWTQEQHGALVRGGKLVVDYDLYRLPQCMGSTYNGLQAWGTTAYARFSPGGQLQQANIVGHRDYSVFNAQLGEFDIPADATSVDLWFMTSGRQCSTTYDSNYGNNYRYAISGARSANVLWAGNFGGSFSRDCSHADGLSEPVSVNSYTRERACMFVDAETWAPGVTDQQNEGSLVEAQVLYSFDGGKPITEYATFSGKAGNNQRFQWTLPRETMTRQNWTKLEYRFRFSTDGVNWVYAGNGDAPRTVVHDATW